MTRTRDDDLSAYALALRRVVPFEDSEVAAGFALVRPRDLPRGTILLRAGEHASEVYVVVSGLLREYYILPDGTERTKAFVAEAEFSGSLADLLSEQPSKAFIVAEEPTRVLAGSHARYRELEGHDASWQVFGRRVLESLLLRKADREYELLGLDAAARYARFATRYPGLEARVAAKQIASYLGITPVHLSRLRRARLAAARGGR